ncbi:MAG: hypothetical protein V3U03_17325 [Myxococcota bacterium]
MPILKSKDAFLASTALAAGASVTGTGVDLREKYGTAIVAIVTNGATGPSTPPLFIVEVSNDDSIWDEIFRAVAKTGNNAKTPFVYRVAPEILRARVKFTAGTGQGSTVVARGHSVDTLG